MEITPAIRRSLDQAGIYRQFHTRSLTDFGLLGVGYAEWIRENGPKMMQEGGLVVCLGDGQQDEIKMVARSFHLNGVGSVVRTLSQLSFMLDTPDGREDLHEFCKALFVTPAQAGRRGCPLSWFDMDKVSSYLRERVEQGHSVFLYWAHDKGLDVTDPLYQWWDQDFVSWIKDKGTLLTKQQVVSLGQKKEKVI